MGYPKAGLMPNCRTTGHHAGSTALVTVFWTEQFNCGRGQHTQKRLQWRWWRHYAAIKIQQQLCTRNFRIPVAAACAWLYMLKVLKKKLFEVTRWHDFRVLLYDDATFHNRLRMEKKYNNYNMEWWCQHHCSLFCMRCPLPQLYCSVQNTVTSAVLPAWLPFWNFLFIPQKTSSDSLNSKIFSKPLIFRLSGEKCDIPELHVFLDVSLLCMLGKPVFYQICMKSENGVHVEI